jgi:hypothetical protein
MQNRRNRLTAKALVALGYLEPVPIPAIFEILRLVGIDGGVADRSKYRAEA